MFLELSFLSIIHKAMQKYVKTQNTKIFVFFLKN